MSDINDSIGDDETNEEPNDTTPGYQEAARRRHPSYRGNDDQPSADSKESNDQPVDQPSAEDDNVDADKPPAGLLLWAPRQRKPLDDFGMPGSPRRSAD